MSRNAGFSDQVLVLLSFSFFFFFSFRFTSLFSPPLLVLQSTKRALKTYTNLSCSFARLLNLTSYILVRVFIGGGTMAIV